MATEGEDADKECLVCGKGVEHGEGFCRLKIKEQMIALCCPMCMDIYQKDPARFLAKLSIRGFRAPGASDTGYHS